MNSVGERTLPCWTPVLNWRCEDVWYICCVGFASLDVVSNELNDCAWNLGLQSFRISVCMFIVSKALFISCATVIVREGGAIWLNPFATVLFNVCSVVTVDCCALYPCCVGVFSMFAVMYGRRIFSSLCNYWEGIWACIRCPCLCLCWVLGWGLC